MPGTEDWQQGQYGEQYRPNVYFAHFGDYQLQQLHIRVQVLFTRMVVVGAVSIHMHMHRHRRLLPVKAKMPVQAYTVAKQPQEQGDKRKLMGGFVHGNCQGPGCASIKTLAVQGNCSGRKSIHKFNVGSCKYRPGF